MKQETIKAKETIQIQITPPDMVTTVFAIEGTAPLVVHKFSQKAKQGMIDKMVAGSTANKGKKREALNLDEAYDAARYISPEGWDGFNASAIRCAAISACRLVGFKMTLAKLSLFVLPDGRDKLEPEIGLIRIYGKPRRLESVARVETGQAYVTIRPCYDEWTAKVHIRFDADQFTIKEVTNLISRVGEQVGIGEGRPDSKSSAGMGWGTFRIIKSDTKDAKNDTKDT